MIKEITCVSCGNKFSGNYCNNCGEKVTRGEDKKLKYFLGEFINAITFVDSKFWRTIKYILIRPGKYSKDFVTGKRKAYMKPISVFFFANLIYFLFPLFDTFNSDLRTQMGSYTFIHSNLAREMVNERIEERGISIEEYAAVYNVKTSELSKLLLILVAVMMAIPLYIIHSKKFFVADHIILSLELTTFVILFAIQLQGAIMYLLSYFDLLPGSGIYSELFVSALALLFLIYFFFQAEINFFKVSKGRAALNTFLCIFGFTVVLYSYRAILFFITFWTV